MSNFTAKILYAKIDTPYKSIKKIYVKSNGTNQR